MITYRVATVDDAGSIAHLHSCSWQQNYRGIWSDEFLNGPVVENRLNVWQNRLKEPLPNQHVIVAESAETLCGFVCLYIDEDPVCGTLVDNLHVRKEQKGHGIGTKLIRAAAEWSCQKSPDSGLYLWVLTQNHDARKFYEHIGGINHKVCSLENPDGSFSDCYQFVWPDLQKLL